MFVGGPTVTSRTVSVVRIASLRAWAQRFSLALLVLGSVGLMMVGKFDVVLLDGVRSRVTDAVAPILDAFSRPAATAADVVEEGRHLWSLRSENARLLAENANLLRYQAVAHRLEAENQRLRELVAYFPAQAHEFATARVIADNSGAFVRSIAINLGADNGVRDGQTILGGIGLVGRTVQTGDRSSRVLLITDLNARIPVMVERSRLRAVLAGDNTAQPRLIHLPPESFTQVGDRVVTSGHGGMFPYGLPVGVVAAIEDGVVRVEPLEDLGRLEYVRILEFEPHRANTAFRYAAGFTESVAY